MIQKKLPGYDVTHKYESKRFSNFDLLEKITITAPEANGILGTSFRKEARQQALNQQVDAAYEALKDLAEDTVTFSTSTGVILAGHQVSVSQNNGAVQVNILYRGDISDASTYHLTEQEAEADPAKAEYLQKVVKEFKEKVDKVDEAVQTAAQGLDVAVEKQIRFWDFHKEVD